MYIYLFIYLFIHYISGNRGMLGPGNNNQTNEIKESMKEEK